jgi:hypothetical protein
MSSFILSATGICLCILSESTEGSFLSYASQQQLLHLNGQMMMMIVVTMMIMIIKFVASRLAPSPYSEAHVSTAVSND